MGSKPIPYGRQDISEDDIATVSEVLRSDFLTQGPRIPELEKALATYTGARYAIAVNSATSALHVAVLALGLGPDSILWCSPNTFVASTNCALYVGAKVDFVDIDRSTRNISPEALKRKLEKSKSMDRLPDALVCVHFAGYPCDMKAIHSLAVEYGFKVIEDASHAIGAEYQGQKIGGGRYSDLTIFSFHPVKIVTSGEGGAVLTDSQELYQKCLLFRSHGITRDPALMENGSAGEWYYEQVDLGFNYRITDIQAALCTSQLKRIDQFISRRREIALYYMRQLAGLGLGLPPEESEEFTCAWHLFVVEVPGKRKEFFDSLRSKNIQVNVHYIPVYWQPYYARLGFERGLCPNAEAYYQHAVSLPIYPAMKEEDVERVVMEVKSSFRQAFTS